MDNIWNEIKNERQNQDDKWGEQNHNMFIWNTILGEEVGEANEATLDAHFANKGWAHYRDELIQVAAVAVAIIECLDRNGYVTN